MSLEIQERFGFVWRAWEIVDRDDPRARRLADEHYPRRTPGAREFMTVGKTLVMLTPCNRATWGVIENLDPTGAPHWRCTIFRNVGAGRSSDLIREATVLTFEYWRRHYGGVPVVPLRTEVDPKKVRPKRDPGRCFIRAGWRVVEGSPRSKRRGLVILEAPTGGGEV